MFVRRREFDVASVVMLMESGDEMGRVLEKFWRELTGLSFVTIGTRSSKGNKPHHVVYVLAKHCALARSILSSLIH
jgi:imidazoleglycerol phosphate dehydratase HisB